MGVQTHEFRIGQEIAGAAQVTIFMIRILSIPSIPLSTRFASVG